MAFTRPSQGTGRTVAEPPKDSRKAAYRALASVPRVASTAMWPVRLVATAGLSAGSRPTMGSAGNSARSTWIAAVVAVLQATTSALMSCARSRCSTTWRECAMT
ncbi:hypothetical protein D3C72_1273430 [compost metagenome]